MCNIATHVSKVEVLVWFTAALFMSLWLISVHTASKDVANMLRLVVSGALVGDGYQGGWLRVG